LDREKQALITFNLIAEDSSSPPNKGVAIVTVTISDYNDNAPIFTRRNYEFDVREDINSSVVVGEVLATDEDESDNGKIHYSIMPSPFGNIFVLFDLPSGISAFRFFVQSIFWRFGA